MKDINGLRAAVQAHFEINTPIAHGFDHVMRVVNLAEYIAQHENYDITEASVAALLHDIGRTVQKEDKGHGPSGVPLASELLDEFTDYDRHAKQRILDAVRDHSLAKTTGRLTHIVQDADMLDGLGAIGLMRAYTSKAYLPAYDPDNIVPTVGKRETNIHDLIAFQLEWLDMMHTNTGHTLAQKRGAFIQEFLRQFEQEVNCSDYLTLESKCTNQQQEINNYRLEHCS
ncbi:MAG: HD domain-containing protein [Candidatus Saccharimonadales bacterium]